MSSLSAASVAPLPSAPAARHSALFPPALVRIQSRAQRELWGLRLARLYGLGVGLSYALATYWFATEPRHAVALWVRGMATASWVAGLGALSLARDLGKRDTAQGLTTLARTHGYGEHVVERARALAGAIRLNSAVVLPGVLIALAALVRFHTLRSALAAVALAALSVPYALLLGSALALLARLCSRWLPERGRLLFLSITLGPWLLALGTRASVPSLPAAFAWLLAHLAGSVA